MIGAAQIEAAARMFAGARAAAMPPAEPAGSEVLEDWQAAATGAGPGLPGALDLLLVSRREHEVYNPVGHRIPALAKRRPYNPAHMNLGDAEQPGVSGGDQIQITSAAGRVEAIGHPAGDIRPGVVSMAHCFTHASATGALIDDATHFHPISGLPRMSAIPIRVRRAPVQGA